MSFYTRWICNPVAIELAKDIRKNPTRWVQGGYRFVKPNSDCTSIVESGYALSIWTEHGYFFIALSLENGDQLNLGGFGKWLVWRAIKWHRRYTRYEKTCEVIEIVKKILNDH